MFESELATRKYDFTGIIELYLNVVRGHLVRVVQVRVHWIIVYTLCTVTGERT